MLLLLLLTASPSAERDSGIIRYDAHPALAAAVRGETVIRGQTPAGGPYYAPGAQGATTFYPPTYAPDGGTSTYSADPFAVTPTTPAYPSPILSDPWLGGGVPPYAAPVGGVHEFYTFGLNGPRPYRMGVTDRVNVGFLPSEGTSGPNVGSFSIFEVDVEKEWVTPVHANWLFAVAPQFNYRAWEGPETFIAPLPGSVYRFGLNLKLATPQHNGWHFEVGFNPAIASDFDKSLSSDGWLFDAYGVAFWQVSPDWTWAFGAAFWDRVDDYVVPYAGVIYKPDQFWEFNLVFPRMQVSYLLGMPSGVATWVYVGFEYDVEAYEITLNPGPTKTRVQYEDWRLFGGLKFEAANYVAFIELGAALGREVEFQRVAPDFDVDDGFFSRLGVRW